MSTFTAHTILFLMLPGSNPHKCCMQRRQLWLARQALRPRAFHPSHGSQSNG
ncbi:hypothetical protein GBA52_027652 [Prunus armeniaca]|nr:hypothetical protein GBA52_027652 [Prunus armeniaca]